MRQRERDAESIYCCLYVYLFWADHLKLDNPSESSIRED